MGYSNGGSDTPYWPGTNYYESLSPGRFHYFFGVSDDSITSEDGKLYQNIRMPVYFGSYDYRYSYASNFWTEQHRPPYWSTFSNNYIMVDRPTSAPVYQPDLAASEHPIVRPSLVGVGDPPFIGSGYFLNTIYPYYRMVNPVYYYPSHGMSVPFGNHGHSGVFERGAETSGATTKQTITFQVVYRSQNPDTGDGISPVWVKLFVNNASDAGHAGRDDGRGIDPQNPSDPHYYRSYPMSPRPGQVISSTTLARGIIYQVQLNLPSGPHTYFFEAYDGFMYTHFPVRPDGRFIYKLNDKDRGVWYEDPWVPGELDYAGNNDHCPGPYINTPSQLSDARVTPTSGPQGTDFEFSVTYRDADGQRPYSAEVLFDTGYETVSLRMKKKDPSKGTQDEFRAGIVYMANTASLEHLVIKPGLRQFRFRFVDDWGRQSDPNDKVVGEQVYYPDSGWINGPLVIDAPRPELLDGTILSDDGSANTVTTWTYKVTYRHGGNLPPSYVKVFIGDRGNGPKEYVLERATPTDETRVPVRHGPITSVSGIWGEPNVTYTLEPVTPTDATHVVVANRLIDSVEGVWDNPSGTGTDYYPGVGKDFNKWTGEIVLGTPLLQEDGTIYPYAHVTYQAGTEYYAGGSFDSVTSIITPQNPVDPNSDVYVTYKADTITWDGGHDMAKRDSGDNLYTDGAVYEFSTRLEGTLTGEPVRRYVFAFETSDGNYVAVYDPTRSPSAHAVIGVPEPFTDLNGNGQYDLREPFEDANHDGGYDWGEPYTDLNCNGQYDWGEPFEDLNENGQYDQAEPFTDINGNGQYDQGEPFEDVNGNWQYDQAEPFFDLDGDGEYDQTEPFEDTNWNWQYDPPETFTDLNCNGQWDWGDRFTPKDDLNGNGRYDAGGELLAVVGDTNFTQYRFAHTPLSGPIPIVGSTETKLVPEPVIYGNGKPLASDQYYSVTIPPRPDRETVCLASGGVNPAEVVRIVSVTGSTLSTQGNEYFDPRGPHQTTPGRYDPVTGAITLSTKLPADANAVVTYLQRGCYYLDYLDGKIVFHESRAPDEDITADYWFAETGPTVGVNTPPRLTNGSVLPMDGAVGTSFTFSVTYWDVDGPRGQAPQYVRVYLDRNRWYEMSYAGSGSPNFRNGAVYRAIINDLGPGSHSYHFEASDGAGFAILDADGSRNSDQRPETLNDFDGPYVGVPLLTNGEAKPNPLDGTIDASQPVTYSVVYYNYNDNRPDEGNPVVWIDNPSESAYISLVSEITAANGAIMNDSTQEWQPGALVGRFIQFTPFDPSSPVRGKVFLIKSNTTNALTVEDPNDPEQEADLYIAGVRAGYGYRIGGLQMKKRYELQSPVYAPVVVPVTVQESLKQLKVDRLQVTGVIAVYDSNPPVYPATDYFKGGTYDFESGIIILGKPLPADKKTAYVWAGVGYEVTVPRLLSCEKFTDLNDNGRYDQGEPFIDLNGNGEYDCNPLQHSFHFKSMTTVTEGGQRFAQEARYPRLGGAAGELMGPVVVEPPPGNSAPKLTTSETGGVTPAHGQSVSEFEFSVYYSDADDDHPGYMRVKIDLESGETRSYDMSPVGSPTNYINPVLYVKRELLPGGLHRFHFETSDGYRSVRLPVFPVDDLAVRVNRTPRLALEDYNGKVVGGVFPSDGNPGFEFTYRVVYSDEDGNPPASVQLVIDDRVDRTYTMYKASSGSDFKTGVMYEWVLAQRTLEPDQPHTFKFLAQDSDPADPRFVGEYAQLGPFDGPIVRSSNAPSLSGAEVIPNAGGESTEFNFRILYRDPDDTLPQYVRVFIDGTVHDCQPSGGETYATGKWFSYKTTLEPGADHRFRFEASDWDHVVCDPSDCQTETTGLPVVSYRPILSNGSVTPSTGFAGGQFVFRVTYKDPDGVPPLSGTGYVRGRVEGRTQPVEMAPVGDPPYDYTAGVVYEGKDELPAGTPPAYQHRYFFEASDGYDSIRFDPPSNTITVYEGSPELRSGAVDPSSGKATTLFLYSVVYVDPNNKAPTSVQAVVDGVRKNMGKAEPSDNNYKDGALYQYSTRLSTAGEHKFYFEATTANFGVLRFPATGELTGPTVRTSTLMIRFDKDAPAVGDTLTVSVELVTTPRLVTDLSLKIVKPNLAIDSRTLRTNASGQATAEVFLDVVGLWKFNAYWAGSSSYDPAEAAEQINVGGPTLQVEASKVQMICPPVKPLFGGIEGMFGADIATALRIARYDPVTGKYLLYSKGSPFPNFVGGEAFWIKPTQTLTLSPKGQLPSQTESFGVQVSAGWNQVGHCFLFPVNWADVKFIYQGETLTLTQASNLGYIRDFAWTWDPDANSGKGSYVLVHASRPGAERIVRTWRGYWVRALVNGTIVFVPPTPEPPPPPGLSKKAVVTAIDYQEIDTDDYPPPVCYP